MPGAAFLPGEPVVAGAVVRVEVVDVGAAVDVEVDGAVAGRVCGGVLSGCWLVVSVVVDGVTVLGRLVLRVEGAIA